MYLLIILNGCVQSSATLFGPALTVARTGNVYQAGLSYTSSSIFEAQIGKAPTKYLKDFLNKNYNSNTFIHTPYKKDKHERVEIFTKKTVNAEHSYDNFLKAVNKILK